MLLFVTVNDHLTLALKSFTGQVEREEAGGSRREAHSPQEGRRRRRDGGGKGEQRMDGWTKGREVCVCVCAGEFFYRKREGESEGCVPQG